MLSRNALGNLLNRYRAVLKKCHLINTFGSLAIATMLMSGGTGAAVAAENGAESMVNSGLFAADTGALFAAENVISTQVDNVTVGDNETVTLKGLGTYDQKLITDTLNITGENAHVIIESTSNNNINIVAVNNIHHNKGKLEIQPGNSDKNNTLTQSSGNLIVHGDYTLSGDAQLIIDAPTRYPAYGINSFTIGGLFIGGTFTQTNTKEIINNGTLYIEGDATLNAKLVKNKIYNVSNEKKDIGGYVIIRNDEQDKSTLNINYKNFTDSLDEGQRFVVFNTGILKFNDTNKENITLNTDIFSSGTWSEDANTNSDNNYIAPGKLALNGTLDTTNFKQLILKGDSYDISNSSSIKATTLYIQPELPEGNNFTLKSGKLNIIGTNEMAPTLSGSAIVLNANPDSAISSDYAQLIFGENVASKGIINTDINIQKGQIKIEHGQWELSERKTLTIADGKNAELSITNSRFTLQDGSILKMNGDSAAEKGIKVKNGGILSVQDSILLNTSDWKLNTGIGKIYVDDGGSLDLRITDTTQEKDITWANDVKKTLFADNSKGIISFSNVTLKTEDTNLQDIVGIALDQEVNKNIDTRTNTLDASVETYEVTENNETVTKYHEVNVGKLHGTGATADEVTVDLQARLTLLGEKEKDNIGTKLVTATKNNGNSATIKEYNVTANAHLHLGSAITAEKRYGSLEGLIKLNAENNGSNSSSGGFLYTSNGEFQVEDIRGQSSLSGNKLFQKGQLILQDGSTLHANSVGTNTDGYKIPTSSGNEGWTVLHQNSYNPDKTSSIQDNNYAWINPDQNAILEKIRAESNSILDVTDNIKTKNIELEGGSTIKAGGDITVTSGKAKFDYRQTKQTTSKPETGSPDFEGIEKKEEVARQTVYQAADSTGCTGLDGSIISTGGDITFNGKITKADNGHLSVSAAGTVTAEDALTASSLSANKLIVKAETGNYKIKDAEGNPTADPSLSLDGGELVLKGSGSSIENKLTLSHMSKVEVEDLAIGTGASADTAHSITNSYGLNIKKLDVQKGTLTLTNVGGTINTLNTSANTIINVADPKSYTELNLSGPVHVSSGDLRISGIRGNHGNINVETGSLSLTNVNDQSGKIGNITVANGLSADTLSGSVGNVTVTAGAASFRNSDFNMASLNVKAGDLKIEKVNGVWDKVELADATKMTSIKNDTHLSIKNLTLQSDSFLIDSDFNLNSNAVGIENLNTDADSNVINTKLGIGQNSMLSLGNCDTAWLTSALHDTLNQDKLTAEGVAAVLGLAKPMKLAEDKALYVGNKSHDEMQDYFRSAAGNSMLFDKNSLLVVDIRNLNNNPALDFAHDTPADNILRVEDGAKLHLSGVNETPGTITIYHPDKVTTNLTPLAATPDSPISQNMNQGWTEQNLTVDNLFMEGAFDPATGNITLTESKLDETFNKIDPELRDLLSFAKEERFAGRHHLESGTPSQQFLSRLMNTHYIGTLEASAITQTSLAHLPALGGVPQLTLSASRAGSDASVMRTSMAQSPSSLIQNNYSGLTLWAIPLYQHNRSRNIDVASYSMDVKSDMGGVTLGADHSFANGLKAGLSLHAGGASAEGSGDLNKTKNQMDFLGAGAYLGWNNGVYSLSADIGYSFVWNDLEQDLDSGLGFGGKVKTDLHSQALSAGIGGEYLFKTDIADINAHAGMRVTHLRNGSYDMEAQGDSLIHGAHTSQTLWTFPVGVGLSRDFQTEKGWHIKPNLDFSVVPALGDLDSESRINYHGLPFSATVNTEMMEDLSFSGQAGVEMSHDRLSFSLNYHLQMSSQHDAHGVRGTLQYRF